MPTNDHDLKTGAGSHSHGPVDDENPGYELTDVNAGGIAVFLAALLGFVLVFFVFCFGMGRLINNTLQEQDGKVTKWNRLSTFAGAAGTNGKRQDLASNAEMQQKELQQMTSSFPNPRLDIDDGNQATADLHAREDLLLDHYSSIPGQSGTVRIPIEQAMQLIAKKGLPLEARSSATETQLAEDTKPEVQVPLTTGFARTGYELDTIEARAQKMNYGKAEASAHAELAPSK